MVLQGLIKDRTNKYQKRKFSIRVGVQWVLAAFSFNMKK